MADFPMGLLKLEMFPLEQVDETSVAPLPLKYIFHVFTSALLAVFLVGSILAKKAYCTLSFHKKPAWSGFPLIYSGEKQKKKCNAGKTLSRVFLREVRRASGLKWRSCSAAWETYSYSPYTIKNTSQFHLMYRLQHQLHPPHLHLNLK